MHLFFRLSRKTRRTLAALVLVSPLAQAAVTDPQRGAAPLAGPNMIAIDYGTSRGGRPLRVYLIGENAARLGRDGLARRPGILLVAGLDGRYTDDPAIADRIAQAASTAAPDSPLGSALARATLYVIPAAHPDGLPHGERRSRLAPYDEDRDRREGEDPPDDLDGDGHIRWLRWPDPAGKHVLDAEHPAGIREAEPGEAGTRYRLVPEGRDDDGDGSFNEDPPGGAAPAKNFAHDHQEHAPDAGPYAFSEPEALALAEFVLGTPSLAAVIVFGEQDNLLALPQQNKRPARSSPNGFFAEDHALMKELGERYREITERSGDNHEDWHGTFVAWAYAHAGLPALATSLLGRRPEAGPKKQDEEDQEKGATPKGKKRAKAAARRHAWALEQFGAMATQSWRAAPAGSGLPKGAELGGFDESLLRRVPDEALEGVTRTHVDFVRFLLESVPRLDLQPVVVRTLDAQRNIARITAQVVNTGLLPIRSEIGRKLQLPAPPRIEIFGKSLGELTDLKPGQQLLIGAPWQMLEELGARGTHGEAEWVVRLRPPVVLQLVLPGGAILERERTWSGR